MNSNPEEDYKEQKKEWIERQIQKIIRIADNHERKNKEQTDGRKNQQHD